MKFVAMFFLLISADATFAAAPPATRPQSYADRYSILSDRNIFLRDRHRATTRPASSQPARRLPEEFVVLRGVALEDEGFRAYVEDLNTLAIQRLSIGDAVARGTVAAIQIDAIQYAQAGEKKWIDVGSDLTGRPARAAETSSSPISSSANGPTTSAGGATTSPASSDDPNLSVEQRLRLRRLQELRR